MIAPDWVLYLIEAFLISGVIYFVVLTITNLVFLLGVVDSKQDDEGALSRKSPRSMSDPNG